MRERFVAGNGIRLFAVEAGPLSGPLVLLLHGWPECWWSWRYQLPVLGEAGYHAVAIDLPGYGRSDKPDATYDEAWVNACIAGAIGGLGHRRAVVVGHDWGGLLAWPFARRYPELTAAVVGVNTPDFPRFEHPPVRMLRDLLPRPNYIVQFQDRGPAEWFLGRDVRAWMEAMFRGPATHRKEVFHDAVLERYVELWSPLGAVSPPLEYYRNIDRNWALRADLPEVIEAPALMVAAANDPALPPALSAGMEERVPNLRRATIDDCGHWTQQEQPEALNAALLAFLADLPLRPPRF